LEGEKIQLNASVVTILDGIMLKKSGICLIDSTGLLRLPDISVLPILTLTMANFTTITTVYSTSALIGQSFAGILWMRDSAISGTGQRQK
jgi:hypothetical protein